MIEIDDACIAYYVVFSILLAFQGEEAIKALNVFHHLTYEGAVDIDAIEDPVCIFTYSYMWSYVGICASTYTNCVNMLYFRGKVVEFCLRCNAALLSVLSTTLAKLPSNYSKFTS